jgi:hypothetical protein
LKDGIISLKIANNFPYVTENFKENFITKNDLNFLKYILNDTYWESMSSQKNNIGVMNVYFSTKKYLPDVVFMKNSSTFKISLDLDVPIDKCIEFVFFTFLFYSFYQIRVVSIEYWRVILKITSLMIQYQSKKLKKKYCNPSSILKMMKMSFSIKLICVITTVY